VLVRLSRHKTDDLLYPYPFASRATVQPHLATRRRVCAGIAGLQGCGVKVGPTKHLSGRRASNRWGRKQQRPSTLKHNDEGTELTCPTCRVQAA
jgi:hypothetical protein